MVGFGREMGWLDQGGGLLSEVLSEVFDQRDGIGEKLLLFTQVTIRTVECGSIGLESFSHDTGEDILGCGRA